MMIMSRPGHQTRLQSAPSLGGRLEHIATFAIEPGEIRLRIAGSRREIEMELESIGRVLSYFS
jgi:hypothetical protein